MWTATMVSSRRASTQMPSTVSTCFFAKARPEACWTAGGEVGGQQSRHNQLGRGRAVCLSSPAGDAVAQPTPVWTASRHRHTAGRPQQLQGRHPNSAQALSPTCVCHVDVDVFPANLAVQVGPLQRQQHLQARTGGRRGSGGAVVRAHSTPGEREGLHTLLGSAAGS